MGWMHLILPPSDSAVKGQERLGGVWDATSLCTRQGPSSFLFTLFHIFTGIQGARSKEGAPAVLVYKKAPVSWTGPPLLHTQGGPGPDRHRLISRLESHSLVLGGSARRRAKKGCCRASPRVSRLAGSYSSMLSIRSKSWWCSSASEVRYRWWWRAGRR